MKGRLTIIEGLCREALDGHVLGEDDLFLLLEADEETAEAVYAAAREMRERVWGDAVFLYGFVYFSTHCRNGCTFCLYRAGNSESPRYRKDPEEVAQVSRELARDGVVLIDLTMGEDPMIHVGSGYDDLLDLVASVSEAAALPLMVSPGLVPANVLGRLRSIGADWYALYQETHDRGLYRRLRAGQPFEARVAARQAARRAGLLVEDGILTGVGDSARDRARSIAHMRSGGCEQVRVMSFVPQPGTPLADVPPPPDTAELLTIAAMRLAMPDRLIPASLDVAGIAGLTCRLDAGANVVTSIVPPLSGLRGVSGGDRGVDDGQRSVGSVLRCLAPLGLHAATVDEYRERLDGLRSLTGLVRA